MPMTPREPTKRVPHNKFEQARDAERRGERTWTNWRARDLIEQVVRVNTRGLTAKDLRAVGNLEYLKVQLLAPTAPHHTGLRMPAPITGKQDQYYGVKVEAARRLTREQVLRWRTSPPSEAELDQAVENLTGRRYYRERRNR